MNLSTTIKAVLLATPLFVSTAVAQAPSNTGTEPAMIDVKTSAEDKKHSVNVSPLGILSGSYGVNYQHLLDGYHGFLVEGNFASSSSGDASSSSIGATVGYRLHWRENQNSGFVGLNLGYYSGKGEATVNGMKTFDVDTQVTSVTTNLGKRWAWDEWSQHHLPLRNRQRQLRHHHG